jgi:hypothetical protein
MAIFAKGEKVSAITEDTMQNVQPIKRAGIVGLPGSDDASNITGADRHGRALAPGSTLWTQQPLKKI